MDGESTIPNRWRITGVIETSICPHRLVSSDSRDWLELYQHYIDGFAAFAGGVLDQPAIYLTAMRVIAQAHQEALKDA